MAPIQYRRWQVGRFIDSAHHESSALSLDTSFYDHVSALLAIIYPKQQEIVAACERHSLQAEFLGVIYSYEGDRPGMSFEPEEVAQIAALGAAIDLDFYNFP